MEQFDFTYKGILRLLNVEGQNAKGQLKKALENATLYDLRALRNSIQEEINLKEVQL